LLQEHYYGLHPLRGAGHTADASDTSTTTWHSQQRLIQIQTPEHTATYRYDLLGRRVQRQITLSRLFLPWLQPQQRAFRF
jgi:YD repeat-containing protein